VRGAGRVGIERGIECVTVTGGSGAPARHWLSRHALRPWRRRSPQCTARVALLLHAADLHLELLIAVLELLDHPRELPDLAFQPIDPKHEVGRAGLRGTLRRRALGSLRLCLRLRDTLGREAFAAAEDDVEQPARPFAVLGAGWRKIRPCGRDRRESKR